MKLGANRYLVAVAGLVVSATFLWVALRNVDGDSLAEAFASVNFTRMYLCMAALSLGIFLRGVRWHLVAVDPRPRLRSFSRATNLGVLVNLLVPGRAGELVRVITLTRLSGSSFAGPVASATIDRLIDVIVLLCSASVLYVLFPISNMLGKWLALLASGLAVVCALVIYARGRDFGQSLLALLAKRWLRTTTLQPAVFLTALRDEFRRVLDGCFRIELVLLAVLILAVDYAAVAALLLAFDLYLPLEAPLLLWVFFAAGSALPSAPGYVGVYQVAAVWALSLFAVSAATAVAVATALQLATLVVALLMAAPSVAALLRRGLLARS